MVNGALGRSLEYSMYSLGRILKAPFRIFSRRTLGHILGQPKDQKPLGPAAPRVFGLLSGLGCGHGFAFWKSLGGPSIFSLGSTLSTLGKLPRGSIHHATMLPCCWGFPTDCPSVPRQFAVCSLHTVGFRVNSEGFWVQCAGFRVKQAECSWRWVWQIGCSRAGFTAELAST